MALYNTQVTLNTLTTDIKKSDSAVREAVANAIDANCKNIYLQVYEEKAQNTTIEVKYFCLDIADDGNGIPIQEQEFEKALCHYKVSPKKEKTFYGRRGKGRYTYLLATNSPNNVYIFTKQNNNIYQIKFKANENENIKISKSLYEEEIQTPIKKDFITLVQLKDINLDKFELEEKNIENIINELKNEIISFFADRIASNSVKIYINDEILKIDDYVEKKILSQKFEVGHEDEKIAFDVDFYIWNKKINLKADRQKHILFIDSNKRLKGILPSGKHMFSIANKKQNHTIIVKSKYFDEIDFFNNDEYENLWTNKIIDKLRKDITFKLEYILFDIYKKHLDEVADEYIDFLHIEKDNITTQVYHSIMYPFIEKFGAKKIHNNLKKVIAKLIDVLIKENPDSYIANLQTILDLNLKENQQLLYIEKNYGIIKAISQKEKYISRIDFLNKLDEMVNGGNRKKYKERSQLHLVVDKNLWIFGEEFENISYSDIISDQSLKTILENEKFFKFDSEELVKLSKEYNLKKIPDIFIPIEKNNIIYIIELKKPGAKINNKIINEIRVKYTNTLKEINKKMPNSKYKKIYALAVSDIKTEDVYSIGDLERENLKIEPRCWKEIIDDTKKRYENIIIDLDTTIKSSKWKNLDEFIDEFIKQGNK